MSALPPVPAKATSANSPGRSMCVIRSSSVGANSLAAPRNRCGGSVRTDRACRPATDPHPVALSRAPSWAHRQAGRRCGSARCVQHGLDRSWRNQASLLATYHIVLAVLVTAIHDFVSTHQSGVDARDKRGHDESAVSRRSNVRAFRRCGGAWATAAAQPRPPPRRTGCAQTSARPGLSSTKDCPRSARCRGIVRLVIQMAPSRHSTVSPRHH